LRCYYRVSQLFIRTCMLKQFEIALRRREGDAPLTDQRRNAAAVNATSEQFQQVSLG
jgi:hypothetical protein